jgi:hypothetical protein
MSDNYETLVVRVPVPLVDHFRQFLDSLDGARELSAWPLDECCLEIEDDDSRIQIGQLDLQVDAADSLSVVSLALFAYPVDKNGNTSDEKLNDFITTGEAFPGVRNETIRIGDADVILMAMPQTTHD